MLNNFPNVVAAEPSKTTVMDHHIPTTDCSAPIHQQPYRILHAYWEEVKKLDEMEKAAWNYQVVWKSMGSTNCRCKEKE